jgi:ABC-2 type transport system ATP-binding protein
VRHAGELVRRDPDGERRSARSEVGTDNGAEQLKQITGVRDVTVVDDGEWKTFSLRVESGADVREQVFQMAMVRRWSVRELTQRKATLEDVFVELTHSDDA